MTLTLSFAPDVEAKLRERAAAAGKDVATLVREAVEEKLASGDGAALPARSAAQWEAEFDAWVRGHQPVGHSIDDSREGIYSGRGE
jgi:hypothetical protein